jgi:hypothetical protein
MLPLNTGINMQSNQSNIIDAKVNVNGWKPQMNGAKI